MLLTNLQELDLSGNDLAGSVPSEIGHLDLQVFNVQGNRLEGTLPVEIGSMKSLVELNVGVGTNDLQGTIPCSIGFLNTLLSLSLELNHSMERHLYLCFN